MPKDSWKKANQRAIYGPVRSSETSEVKRDKAKENAKRKSKEWNNKVQKLACQLRFKDKSLSMQDAMNRARQILPANNKRKRKKQSDCEPGQFTFTEDSILWFGKWSGTPIGSVPVDYLTWLAYEHPKQTAGVQRFVALQMFIRGFLCRV